MALRHETGDQTLSRLLAKARQDGIRLYRDRTDGRYYASSASDPDTLHYVTGYSCDCAGFFHHGACKHYAALMAALGWLPGSPAPQTLAPAVLPQPARCESCGGMGEVPYTRQTGRRSWEFAWQTCPRCGGTGHALPAAA